jgi:hypothetical protein
MEVKAVKEIEEVLNEEKKHIDSLIPPPDFETRLRSALDAAPSKKTKHRAPFLKIAAVSAVCFVLIGYNYNSFAFYGKKLFGFDEIVSETLKDLNEKGMGQMVDKKTTLPDGTELTIDGMMTDANQLILYYTLSNPYGLDERVSDNFSPRKIAGFLTNSQWEGGVAQMNEDGTELKGTLDFEPVNHFAKELTFHFEVGTEREEGSITFDYYPNKAMQTQIKQPIKEKMKVDKGTLTFKTITATPTSTFIEGTMKVDDFDRISLGLGGIDLMANGKFVDKMGSSVGSTLTGSEFELRFDALPEQLDSLEIVVREFIGYKKLEEKLPLAAREGVPFNLDGYELWIKEVAATARGIEITIATDENLLLDGVSIESDNSVTPLQTTTNHIEKKQEEGRFLKERTMLFETKSMPDYLIIEGIHYVKQYNKIIEIPVN